MTYLDVKAHYINEEMEIALATQKQIDRLCKEVGSDRPQMVYDLYQEELEAMLILISIREDFINADVAVEYLEDVTEEVDSGVLLGMVLESLKKLLGDAEDM